MKNTLFSTFITYLKDTKGSAFIELAFATPILIIIFFGVIRIADYVRTIQKCETSIIAVTDVVSQFSATATNTEMTSITNALPLMMGFTYTNNVKMNIILTDVQKTPNGTQIVWQYKFKSPNETAPSTSVLGNPSAGGNCMNISSNTNVSFMANGDEVLFGEIYYKYQPIYTFNLTSNGQINRDIIPPISIYKRIFFLPRNANLANVGFNTTNCNLQ